MTDTPLYTTNPLKDMQAEVKAVNVANGWFEGDRTVVEGQMLMVTEVAEAVEAYRKWGLRDMTGLVNLDKAVEDPETGDTVFKPEGVGSEYADQFIRLLDACERDGIDLFFEYGRKLQHNCLRGYRHGGKLL